MRQLSALVISLAVSAILVLLCGADGKRGGR